MKFLNRANCAALLLVLLSLVDQAHSKSTAARPSSNALTKVVAMLQDMADAGNQDMQDEQVEYAKFSTFCGQQQKMYDHSINKLSEEIDKKNGDIGVFTAAAKGLGKEIAELGAQVESDTADLEEAKARRTKGKAAYLKQSEDYAESIAAITDAITILKKQDYDRPVSAVLMQISRHKGMPLEAQSAIASMLDDTSKDSSEQAAPEANAYEFQSGGILEMLGRLSSEFKAKLREAQKSEMNAQHAYEMVVTDLQASIELGEKTKEEKTVAKLHKEQGIALLKQSVATAEAEKASDEKARQDLGVECRTKSASYESKQQLREDEIAAINQAIEILGGTAVTKGKVQLSFQEVRSATVLAQFLESNSKAHAEAKVQDVGDRDRVRDFLAKEGSRLKSKMLSLVAQKIYADPFADLKEMINTLVNKLMDEQFQETQQQGFCTTELNKNKLSRTKLTQDIDALTSELENTKALIISLSEEIASLQQAISDLHSSMSEATKMRLSEKVDNTAKIAEAKDAGAAVERATSVLKDFYMMASKATAVSEVTDGSNPKMGTPEWEVLGTDKAYSAMAPRQTFGKVYTGQQEKAGGVVALLEVIQSDFMTIVTTTEQAEVEAKRQHEYFMGETKQNVVAKEKTLDLKSKDRIEAESKVLSLKSELSSTEKEMNAALNYYDSLKPQCLQGSMTFEERQKAAKAEIQSLKEALEMLGGPPVTIR